MIYQTFKSKRQPVFVPSSYLPASMNGDDCAFYTEDDYKNAKEAGVSVQEFVRRDSLIKQLATEFPIQTGDTAFPTIKKDYEQYGPCMVFGICRSYKDFGFKSKWPKNDNPMIVTFAPVKLKGQHIWCTTNYLTKKNPHLVVC